MDRHTKWDGRRIKHPDHPAIYLVENKCKRLIPDKETYHKLFSNWKGIIYTRKVDEVPTGKDISTKSRLIGFLDRVIEFHQTADTTSPVIDSIKYWKFYLEEDGIAREIVGDSTWDRYHFNDKAVNLLSKEQIEAIPKGESIVWNEK